MYPIWPIAYWWLPIPLLVACRCLSRSTMRHSSLGRWTCFRELPFSVEISPRAILNKSWRQHPTKQQLFGHLPPITKTIQVRRNRHAGHCWRSRDELISDVLQWTPSDGRAKARRPARPYKPQLCEDTGWSPGDQLDTINDREGGAGGSAISVPMAWQDDEMMYPMYP